MTNEEAVKILRRIQEPEAWEPQINGAAFEALDMAIEALGRQQAAGSKDLISRSSLLAKYDEQHEGPPGRARKLIEDEPPVLGTNLAEVGTDRLAEPKRGKWSPADSLYHGAPFYYCSECGEKMLDTVMGKPRWNFCPHCGADMRGEQNE